MEDTLSTTAERPGGGAEPPPRPQPDLDDPLLAPFWEGTAEGRLLLRRCSGCGGMQWPPRPLCAHCAGVDFSWEEGPLEGTIHSFVVARRAFHHAFAARVPYVIAAVDVVPGVRMIGNVLEAEPEEVAIDAAVTAEFLSEGGAATLVCWRLADGDKSREPRRRG